MEETFIKEHSKSSTRIYPQYESSSRDVSQDGQGHRVFWLERIERDSLQID